MSLSAAPFGTFQKSDFNLDMTAERPSLPTLGWADVKRKIELYLFGLGASEVDGACNHAHGCQVVFADVTLVK